jgi:hypothetical protein
MKSVQFYDPHPNDGSGPAAYFSKAVEEYLHDLDQCEVGEKDIKAICLELASVAGEDFISSDHTDYICLTQLKGHTPVHHWRAIRYKEIEND